MDTNKLGWGSTLRVRGCSGGSNPENDVGTYHIDCLEALIHLREMIDFLDYSSKIETKYSRNY